MPFHARAGALEFAAGGGIPPPLQPLRDGQGAARAGTGRVAAITPAGYVRTGRWGAGNLRRVTVCHVRLRAAPKRGRRSGRAV